ncbi:hypothetical protein C7401_1368 [Paraburkholderia unamae]|uniref:hypothetical protein n=1 Tax=Paraburkholderia unamae TaxID=219649 RepID=UPI000DC2CC21|nr:hypothetical protein [Paraburkholderia unamae]RAR51648.1 hypothetical protein C7401_1368 [Paraburkholderia unamae]
MSNETMKDGERAAFEAWMLTGELDITPNLERDGEFYEEFHTQRAWRGWQARAASQATVKGDEPVGEAGSMPGTDGFTMAAFEASKVPIGTKLYTRAAAPQAGATLPPDVRALLTECAGFHGQMVKGNWLSAEVAKLLAAHPVEKGNAAPIDGNQQEGN